MNSGCGRRGRGLPIRLPFTTRIEASAHNDFGRNVARSRAIATCRDRSRCASRCIDIDRSIAIDATCRAIAKLFGHTLVDRWRSVHCYKTLVFRKLVSASQGACVGRSSPANVRTFDMDATVFGEHTCLTQMIRQTFPTDTQPGPTRQHARQALTVRSLVSFSPPPARPRVPQCAASRPAWPRRPCCWPTCCCAHPTASSSTASVRAARPVDASRVSSPRTEHLAPDVALKTLPGALRCARRRR